jgi:hypothetical protein
MLGRRPPAARPPWTARPRSAGMGQPLRGGPPSPGRPACAARRLPRRDRVRGDPRRALLTEGGGGPQGVLPHRELRERSAPSGSGPGCRTRNRPRRRTAALLTGLLAVWPHGQVALAPEELARHLWRLLLALHRAVHRPYVPPRPAMSELRLILADCAGSRPTVSTFTHVGSRSLTSAHVGSRPLASGHVGSRRVRGAGPLPRRLAGRTSGRAGPCIQPAAAPPAAAGTRPKSRTFVRHEGDL